MAASAVPSDTHLIILTSKDKLYLQKSSSKFTYKVFCLSLIFLIVLSFGKLKLSEANLTSVKEAVGNTPITLTFKERTKNKGIVFLAHGFADPRALCGQ